MFEIWRQNHKPVKTSFGDKIQIYLSEKEIANIKQKKKLANNDFSNSYPYVTYPEAKELKTNIEKLSIFSCVVIRASSRFEFQVMN